MKKFLPYILTVIILANFFVPVSFGMDGTVSHGIEINIAHAAPGDTKETIPECGIIDGTIGGCIGQIFYWIFGVTAWLFAAAGKFFDFTFAYSISDTSYRSAFIVEGWQIVRDFCNMFFIFVLLYAAFATILNLHGFKTKEIIINVILIGLLINFSLFTTQVVVDASNILARVFYKATATPEANTTNYRGGVDTSINSKLGEKNLSEAIITKINPQRILLEAQKRNLAVTDSNTSGRYGSNYTSDQNLDTTTFILVTVLAIIINVIGIWIFLSVGLIFIARVIGLSLAMILAPIAFFTYTLPSLRRIGTVGIDVWLSDLLSLAFLAPIFMFFMYLIVQFVSTGLGVLNPDDTEGVAFYLSIIIPFAFIMILLKKAASVAKKMSGEIGAMVTSLATTGAGFALGAGLGATALLGRASIGRAANWLGGRDTLNNLAAGKNRDGSAILDADKNIGTFLRQKLAIVGKKGTNLGTRSSFDARQLGAASMISGATGLNLAAGTGMLGLGTASGLGGYKGTLERQAEKRDRFKETLGYDHHTDQELGNQINERKDQIEAEEKKRDLAKSQAQQIKSTFTGGVTTSAAYQAQKLIEETANRNIIALKTGGIYRDTVAGSYAPPVNITAETSLNRLEKVRERNLTARQKEYEEYIRKQSGMMFRPLEQRRNPLGDLIFNPDGTPDMRYGTERDQLGNIKAFAQYEHGRRSARRVLGALITELGSGFMAGVTGAPVAGLAFGAGAMGAGTIAGVTLGAGIIMGLRQAIFKYSGTANRHYGDQHNSAHGHDNYTHYHDNYHPGGGADTSGFKRSGGGGGGGGSHGGH